MTDNAFRQVCRRRYSLRIAVGAALMPLLSACTSLPLMTDTTDRNALATQVRAAEAAFARSMAQRDLAAFAAFVDPEAVFFSGPAPLRGQAAVVAFWSRYFDGPVAPFSWEPGEVEVLDSGTLALSSGPVRNPQGEVVARFTSVWRLAAPGVWRVVFDKGSEVCRCNDARAAP